MEFIVSNAKCTAVRLTVRAISGDTASVSFETLNGNKPNTNGNSVAIWPAVENTIPWDDTPLKQYPVPMDQPKGDMILDDLNLPENSYILGYSLSKYGDSPASAASDNNFCASVFVPSLAEGTEYTQTVMDIEVEQIGSYSATISYTALPGYSPKDHDNWIGIWDASASILHDTPQCAVAVGKTTYKGKVALNNLQLVSGHSYVVGYFTGGYKAGDAAGSSRDQLACMVQFNTVAR